MGPTGSTIGGGLMTIFLHLGLPEITLSMAGGPAKKFFCEQKRWITDCLGKVSAQSAPTDIIALVTAAYTVKELKAKIKKLDSKASTAGVKAVIAARLVGLPNFDLKEIMGSVASWKTVCLRNLIESWYPPRIETVHLATGLTNESTVFRQRLADFLGRIRHGESEFPLAMVPIETRFAGLIGPLDKDEVRVSADGFTAMQALPFASDASTDEYLTTYFRANSWAEDISKEPQVIVIEVKTRSSPSTIQAIRKIRTSVGDNKGAATSNPALAQAPPPLSPFPECHFPSAHCTPYTATHAGSSCSGQT